MRPARGLFRPHELHVLRRLRRGLCGGLPRADCRSGVEPGAAISTACVEPKGVTCWRCEEACDASATRSRRRPCGESDLHGPCGAAVRMSRRPGSRHDTHCVTPLQLERLQITEMAALA